MRTRLLFSFAVLFVFMLAIWGRLVHLQIFEHARWSDLASRIQERQIIETAHRGRIFDRNGTLLAYDIKTLSIAVDGFNKTKPERLLAILKETLKLPENYLRERIYKEGYFTWIARKVDVSTAETIKQAAKKEEVRGLIFLEEWKRVYPQKDLASNVMGFAGLDNKGLEGIELMFDELLRGEETIYLIKRAADGTQVRRQVLKAGNPGNDIYLTLDSKIQYITERELDEGVKKFRAKDGFAIVMDPKTGEVLAMAQAKRYDLNGFQDSTPAQRLNKAVAHAFEPGSAFKIFAALAALEYGAVSPGEYFDGNEPVIIAGHAFNNSEGVDFGPVTLTDIIKDSINTGMIRVAQRLGEERLYEFLQKLEFGRKTGLELPGEIAGFLPPLRQWSKLEIGAIPIGQAVAVTGIQLISRTAAIANNGLLLKPQIIKRIQNAEGRLIQKSAPQAIKQIASSSHIGLLKGMMREVIKEGTGTPAEIEGFEPAAKTGTGQKALPGQGYIKNRYTTLIEGFFPMQDPQYAILVVLDEPGVENFWGGQTAGPIFKAIAEGIIQLKKLRPP